MNSIVSRLKALELQYKTDPLIVLAHLDSGENVVVSMQECIERNLSFAKVLKGSSLNDLDLLLAAFRAAAELEEI